MKDISNHNLLRWKLQYKDLKAQNLKILYFSGVLALKNHLFWSLLPAKQGESV